MHFSEANSKGGRMLDRAVRLLGIETARSTWDALTRGTGSGPLADATMVTMPQELAVTVRQPSGVPATFFLATIADATSVLPAALASMSGFELREHATAAWKCLADRAALANDIEEGFGCDKSDAWETTREVTEGKWAESKVAEIAQLAGRMYEALRGVRLKTEDALPQEVKGVEMGGDFSRLLASEVAQVGSACRAMSDLATMRVMQRRAMQLRFAGEKEVGRGPLVIALDESGSMHDHGSVKRNTWAKSAAVALTRLAHDAGRMVRVVHFSTTMTVTECKPGDRAAVLKMACHFLSGGTDIQSAVRCATEQVKDLEQSGCKGADIVVVTDGGCNSSDDVAIAVEMAKAAERGIRFWTVAIAREIDASRSLRDKAARYVHLTDTDDVGAIKGLKAAADSATIRR